MLKNDICQFRAYLFLNQLITSDLEYYKQLTGRAAIFLESITARSFKQRTTEDPIDRGNLLRTWKLLPALALGVAVFLHSIG